VREEDRTARAGNARSGAAATAPASIELSTRPVGVDTPTPLTPYERLIATIGLNLLSLMLTITEHASPRREVSATNSIKGGQRKCTSTV
jgi:hypothetical protein